MRIMLRQCLGGFRARFDGEKKWGELAKSKAEAVGKLIMASLRRVGVRRIDWDRGDPWTKNYLEGKKNRRSFPPPSINFAALPHVDSEAAKELMVDELPLPTYLSNALVGVGYRLNLSTLWDCATTLGQLSQHTEAEIRAVSKPLQPVGKKCMEQLRQLLKHYSLSFKEE